MDITFYELIELFFNTINPNYCDDYESEDNNNNTYNFIDLCSDYFDQINSNV